MENLLFINACVRGERSRTLKLARRFLDAYRAAHPDTVITERDLCAARLQPQYPEVLAERDALWSAGKLEQPMFEPAWQFAAADKLVIAAPFWDMSFPAILKIYLERISVTDLTFGYSEEGAMVGLCRASKLLYITTRGGNYAGTPMETATPVLKALCTMYGIPEFRLPKSIVQKEVDNLKALGVKVETNMVIGRILTIEELKDEYGYEAVFVGSGAGLPRFMGIPGESLKGVYSANEFLTRSNLMKAYLPTSKTPIRTGKKVAVVGGGNVAMDAARSALRLGAETVYIVYRRGMAELPARKEEVEHAEEEGIIFKTLCNPVEIHPNDEGFVKSITCIEMELGEPDASGRRRPIEKKGSEFELDVDTVIMSLGTSPNPLIRSTTPGLETNKHGCIVTDGDDGKTSRDGVYAGGDAVTGAATVIKAMGAGKAAAKAIDEYIQSK